MILNEDYKLREDMTDTDTLPVELLLDPYKGVIYRYTVVSILEERNNQARLKFAYELYEMGDHTETSLRKDKRFEEVVGLVLNEMILQTLPEDEIDDTEIRGDDSPEPAEE